jgi:uncharacterized damage-inducible protein DinB
MRDTRPEAADYNQYYRGYVDLVPDGDIVETLGSQWAQTRALLDSVPADREEYRYAPGKWSLREVVGHLIDVERLFAFRSLWIARAAEDAQPGMDQDAWAALSNAGGRPLADLTNEWAGLRNTNLDLFGSFDDEAWMRTGVASGFEVRMRALPWIVAGHELYHRALLKRDYLEGGA